MELAEIKADHTALGRKILKKDGEYRKDSTAFEQTQYEELAALLEVRDGEPEAVKAAGPVDEDPNLAWDVKARMRREAAQA